ncbi:hypothetical protein D3C72_1828190 [compost metagenome]
MAMLDVVDGDAVQAQARFGRHRFQARARGHQHGRDQAGSIGVERAGQAQFIARMDHGHPDRSQSARVLEQAPRTVAVMQAYFGQGGARPLDLLGGRDHLRLAF